MVTHMDRYQADQYRLEKQREGIKTAKAEGRYKGGHPKKIDPETFRKYYQLYMQRKLNKSQLAAKLGVSRSTLYAKLDDYISKYYKPDASTEQGSCTKTCNYKDKVLEAQQYREWRSQRIKEGQSASNKKSGRPEGKIYKLTDELKADICLYLSRQMKQVDILKKHNISKNTCIKYAAIIRDTEDYKKILDNNKVGS